MTREAKVGLMMVAVLVGVFGFLIYKRVHRPSEAMAQEISREDRREFHDHDRDGEVNCGAHEQEFDRVEHRHPPTIVDKIENTIENAVDEFEQEIQSLAKPKPKPKRHAPARELERENKRKEEAVEEELVQFEPPKEVPERHHHIEVPEPIENEFDQFRDEAHKHELAAPKRNEPEADPFDNELKTRRIDYNKKSIRQVNSDPFDDAPATPPHHAEEIPAAEPELPAEEPRRVREYEERNDFAPRAKRQAAPVTLAEDDFASPPPRHEEPAPARNHDREIDRMASRPHEHEFDHGRHTNHETPQVGGPTYTVQPNDNFWTISRKRYGAGRFYMALAMHNQHNAPDPKNMRPGLVLQTPDAGFLEQRYGHVIPKAAPPEPFQPIQASHVRRPREVEPVGFFVSPEGFPMYRVGDRDTLTGIAKIHLGRSSRWVQIMELNRNVLRDGNALTIGTVLRLPADASRVQVAEGAREFR